MTSPNSDPQTETHERFISPSEAINISNRDVITAIYAAADEAVPDALIQETNGSKAYINFAGLIRLVYEEELDETGSDNPYGLPVNPAIDKLSKLVISDKVSHTKVLGAYRKFRPASDSVYKAIDKASGNIYSFTDNSSGEVICYSIKVDSHSQAETVLVSPEHIYLAEYDELYDEEEEEDEDNLEGVVDRWVDFDEPSDQY